MITKIRNYSLAAFVICSCLLGLAGPLMFPELMVEAQMHTNYMPLI